MASLPTFYDPKRIGRLFYPDSQRIAENAESAKLSPASEDTIKVLLIIVDMQIDFCHEDGALYVPGAIDDIRRLIEFTYRNAERISHITCSLDSHLPLQIFHQAWWVNPDGMHPEPYTILQAEDIQEGRWTPLLEPEWSIQYVTRLEESSKKQLMIWPYHVPIGGMGNALDPELWSVVFWHSIARKSQPTWWTKGSIPKTEHYSILRPEIEIPEEPKGSLSQDFINALAEYDYLLIAGEAESHCVLETSKDLVEVFSDRPEQLNRIHILQDCMSPVPHHEVDFHALAIDQFEKFKKEGIRLINSTDPLPF